MQRSTRISSDHRRVTIDKNTHVFIHLQGLSFHHPLQYNCENALSDNLISSIKVGLLLSEPSTVE